MSEVERYVKRMVEKGVTNMHVDWTSNASPEVRAAELNRIEDWLEVPVNRLTSRLDGEIFMLEDAAQMRTNVKTGEVTLADKSKLRLVEFLKEVSAFIKENCK